MTATVEHVQYKFRLKESSHVYRGPDGSPMQAIQGDTVDTVDDDLAARFGADKFELIDRQVVQEPFAQASPGVAEAAREGFAANTIVDDGLDGMSVPELRKVAKAEDIDITEATGKEEIVAVIRMARDAA